MERPTKRAVSRHITFRGQHIWVEDRGPESAPVVLLLHGNSHSSRAFDALGRSAALSAYRRVALDLPGHGRSVPEGARGGDAPLGASMGGHVEALARVAEHLGGEPLAVVGHSLGGHVALQAAGRIRPAGVMVVGTPPARSVATLADGFQPNPAVGLALAPSWSEADVAAWCEAQTPPGEEPAAHLRADAAGTPGRARAELGEGLGEEPYEDEVAVVEALGPRLALCLGEHDRLVDAGYLERLGGGSWRGGLQVIRGAGHGPHYQRPEAFGELLGAFLDDLRAAA